MNTQDRINTIMNALGPTFFDRIARTDDGADSILFTFADNKAHTQLDGFPLNMPFRTQMGVPSLDITYSDNETPSFDEEAFLRTQLEAVIPLFLNAGADAIGVRPSVDFGGFDLLPLTTS